MSEKPDFKEFLDKKGYFLVDCLTKLESYAENMEFKDLAVSMLSFLDMKVTQEINPNKRKEMYRLMFGMFLERANVYLEWLANNDNEMSQQIKEIFKEGFNEIKEKTKH